MMKSYNDYKNTKYDWMGSIPIHWDAQKIRELFTERKEKVSDKDYAPLSVSRGGIVPQISTVAKSNDGDNRKLVRNGDFAINSRSDRRGSSGLSIYDGSVSLINIVLCPRTSINGRYTHYLLKSHSYIEEFYRNGRGIVADLWTTRYAEMKSIVLPLPPLSEQDQIVRYLDWQVSKTNKLISALKKQIALLNEQKQTVINDAVTKGLDPNAQMKDSGATWIGEIPAEFHIRPFSKVAHVCANLVHPEDYPEYFQVSPASIEKNSGRLLMCGTVREAGIISDNHLFKTGQILYSKVRPMLNKVTIAPFDGLCSADMYPIETVLVTRYLMYYMLSFAFLSQLSMTGNRVKMPKINKEELSGILIIFPDGNSQKKIVAYLDEQCVKADELIENISAEIALLSEYRTRLICDVVTGQIDVRDIDVPDFEYITDEVEDASDDESIDTEETVDEEA